MARAKPKSRPLRGSVTQNNPSVDPGGARSLLFKIRLWFSLATAGALALVVAWMWLSGWAVQQVRQIAHSGIRMTQRAHFAVRDVVVEGREHTDKTDLFQALGVNDGAPILLFDSGRALEKISQLPWVDTATVQRRLPDTIYVRLRERQPMARWQHDNATVVIDAQGKVLAQANPESFPNLLLVVGENAPEQTASLLNSLNEFPDILSRVTSAVRVGERRWNLYLQTGQLVRLPEQKMTESLKRLNDLVHDQKLLDRNITGIDLRLSDRLILEPGAPTATESMEKPRS